ncbi:MAG: SDR family oxidoreductase [Actinomycetes bacterium]
MSAILVTGGAGGIGMAICRRVVAGGATAIAADLPEAIAAVSEEPGITFVEMDVADRASVDAGVAEAVELSPLGGLVNCAGILRDSYLDNVDDEMMRAMFEINLAGMHRVTDATVPHLPDGSAIVNIGSLTGQMGRFVGASMYGATKAGVAAYTRYLAVELAPRGIRVNNVAPGVIDLPMSRSMHSVSGGAEAAAAHVPLGRLGTAEEVAEVVEFLLSSRASYVTAQTLLVDGGFIAW